MTMSSSAEPTWKQGSVTPTMPPINLAHQQMCQEAERAVSQMNSDLPKPILEHSVPRLSRMGHCWCGTADLGAVPHRFCCKCGDRYAVDAKAE